MQKFRTESDTLGSKNLPANVLYGIQTQRAVENFPISGIKEDEIFIKSYIIIKKASALANVNLGKLNSKLGKLIVHACDKLLSGKYNDQFVVDVYQAGAGTSFNMNVNEVITNLILEITGHKKGDYTVISPNDHVNMSQSTNDTFPTAMQMASLMKCNELITVLKILREALLKKSTEFKKIKKSGRTHLQDAVPLYLGDEFKAYASSIENCIKTLLYARRELAFLPIGGTAIGTGVNTPKGYKREVVKALNQLTGLNFKPARDAIYAVHSCYPILQISHALQSLAVALTKIANDLRMLCSGPVTGFDEINLPAVQPGSSIMPGKVNPVMAECLNMICFQVIGNDLTVTLATQAGQLELNVMMPVMIYSILHSFKILINYLPVFADKCIVGIQANEEKCRMYYENNPIMVTLASPIIGYKKAAEVVKTSMKEKKSIKQILIEQNLLTKKQVDKIFKRNNVL